MGESVGLSVVADGEVHHELRELASELSPAQPSPEQHAVDQYPTGSRFFLTVLALSLTIFLVALDSTIVAQAIPEITQNFGSIADIVWYSTAYTLSNTSFKLVWGNAYNCFPLERTYLIAVILFEIGNIVCAVATSSTGVILGRLISGLGGGGLMSGSFIIMALIARPERRAMMMAITSVTFGCSSVVGPLLGGVLVDSVGWRWCFWINLPLGFLAAGTLAVFFRAPLRASRAPTTLTQKLIQMDVNGGLLVAASLCCFVFAMHLIGTDPWKSPAVIGSLTGAGVLALLFIGNEIYMGDKAVVQSHLLRNRLIVRNCFFAFFLAGVFFPLLYLLPIQFQSVGAESAAQSGVRLIPLVLGISVFTLITNGVLTFWQYYNTIFVFGALCATVGAAVMYTFDANSPTKDWIGSELVASVGIGAALQVPIIANQAVVGLNDIPIATSLALFLENVGTTVFVAVTDGTFTRALVHGIKTRLPDMDPSVVINAGATQLRNKFSPSELPSILDAYLEGCKTSHIVPVACGSLAGLLAIGSELPVASSRLRAWVSKPHSG